MAHRVSEERRRRREERSRRTVAAATALARENGLRVEEPFPPEAERPHYSRRPGLDERG